MSGAGFEIICNSCRTTVPSDATACPGCGVGLFGPMRAAPAPAAALAAPVGSTRAIDPVRPVYASASGGLTAGGYAFAAARQAIAAGSYAGFWIRAVAVVIDSVLTGIALAAVYVTAGMQPTLVAAAGVGLLYQPLMESSGSRGTLGKIICGLTVADLGGRRISFGRAFARNLAKVLSALTVIGYLMAGWTRHKQALHDILAETVVLKH